MATLSSFVPASELTVVDVPLPRGCTFPESDWRALAPFWYPVAFSREVSAQPLAVRLLDDGPRELPSLAEWDDPEYLCVLPESVDIAAAAGRERSRKGAKVPRRRAKARRRVREV